MWMTTMSLCNPLLAAGSSTSIPVFRHFVIEGGPITWFVLIPLSVVSIGLILHYLLTIRRGTQTPAGLAKSIVTFARQGLIHNIEEIAAEDDSMLGQAARAAAVNAAAGRDAATVAIDEAVEEHAGRLMRRIEYLNVIGNIGPMIGLLGTVVGMIQAFSRIQMGGGAPDPNQLVGDIAIALVNTFWGLFVAIPGLTAFAFFRNRIDAYAAECLKLCDRIVELAEAGESAKATSGKEA
jgi:biopolymer transport protein ExbB